MLTLQSVLLCWLIVLPPVLLLYCRCTAQEAAAMDCQGRCVITDHGLFVLVNAYLPACSNTNQHNLQAQFRVTHRSSSSSHTLQRLPSYLICL